MPRLTALKMNPNGMDSLAPARSALVGFWLRQTPFAVSQTAQVKSISPAVAPQAFGATLRNHPHKSIHAEGVGASLGGPLYFLAITIFQPGSDMRATTLCGFNPAAVCQFCIALVGQFPEALVSEKYRPRTEATTPPSPGVSV